MAVNIDIVKAYTPAVRFHEHERNFPCRIEHILQGATLKHRLWTPPRQILTTHTGCPAAVAAAVFKDHIYIAFPGEYDQQLYVRRSQNGRKWGQPAVMVSGERVKASALAEFLGKLWIVYVDDSTGQISVRSSSNGQTWDDPKRIERHTAKSAPCLVVFGDKLHLVYSGDESQICHSQSADGFNWVDNEEIEGQYGTNLALTVFNDEVIMIYPEKTGTDQLLCTRYTTSSGWSTPTNISNQRAYHVSLASIDVDQTKWLVMTYRDSTGPLICTRSLDGTSWEETKLVSGQFGNTPALCTFAHEGVSNVFMVYTGTEFSKQLFITHSSVNDWSRHPDVKNPAQEDLQNAGADRDFYLDILDRKWKYDQNPGPNALYFVWNRTDTEIKINYVFLYAGRHGQTVHVLRNGHEFDAQLSTFGEQAGDLHRFQVTLKIGDSGVVDPSNDTLTSALFPGRRTETVYNAADLTFTDSTHANISIALNSHYPYNTSKVTSPIQRFTIPGLMMVGDFIGEGQLWRPTDSQLIQFGLDPSGKSVDGQHWSAFRGRIGDSHCTTLSAAFSFGSTDLNRMEFAFVEQVKPHLRSDECYEEGPEGPGGQAWIHSSSTA